jgi:LysM repeat protein
MVRRIVYLYAALGFLFSSCTQATIQPTPTLGPTGIITPYHTITPSPVSPTSTQIAIIPVTPAPTSTPFMHTVKKDETMLGIAFQYGILLEDLKAANPGVDPRFLSVSMQLVIPISGEIPEIIPTPTPVPLEWQQPKCYRTGDGGAWCILSVKNQLETSVENLSAWIGLFTPQGVNISSQVAYAPINLLRPSNTIPLMSYFAPPLPEEFEAHAELLSGLAVAIEDTRYLDLEVNVEKVEISADGRQALVSGDVILPDGIPMPSQLWALIVAYDSNGNIIGARKWESTGEAQFGLTVYCVAGMIDHIEVLTEARP